MRVIAPLDALRSLANEQHGVVSFTQVVDLGCERWRVRQLARAQNWRRVLPGVYAMGEPSDDWKQRVMAACLWAGPDAVASHRTAAGLHGLDAVGAYAKPRPEEVHLSVSRSRRPRRKGITVHRIRGARPNESIVRDSIPCTTVLRTLVDLAGVLPQLELAMAVESAWRADSDLLDDLDTWLRRHGSGFEGVATLRRILADCAERSHKPMDSAFEVRCWYWLKSTGLPLPSPQYPYAGHGDYVRFIDFAYVQQKLAIETDGFEFHRERDAFENDAAKLSYLAANDWRVIHVTWRMLERNSAALKRWIALALDLPGSGAGPGVNRRKGRRAAARARIPLSPE